MRERGGKKREMCRREIRWEERGKNEKERKQYTELDDKLFHMLHTQQGQLCEVYNQGQRMKVEHTS